MDPQYEGLTFGVVSLQGQQQSRLIEQMLIDELGFEAFEERALRAGTPQDFQGDERNVVFISVVADDARYSAVKTPDKQRTNVAASRAQDQLWVFHSVEPATLHLDDQRRALIEYVANGGRSYRPNPNDLAQCDSDFERDVLHDIHAKGYDVIPQYPVGKFRIDLVVQHRGGRLAVECDGDRFHGAEQYESDIRRQRVLERMGWKFWRIRASEYYLDSTTSMASLWELLARRERAQVSVRRQQHHADVEERSSPDSDGIDVTLKGTADETEIIGSAGSHDKRPADVTSFEVEDQDAEFGHSVDPDTFNFAPTTEPDYDFGGGSKGLWILVDEKESVAGTPMVAKDEAGAREVEGIRIPCRFVFNDVTVDFSMISWSTGSGEVICNDMLNGGHNLMRLLHGGRLGVYRTESGDQYAEIRIMRPGSNGLPTAQIPQSGELRKVLGWSLNQFLELDMDVERIGTRAEVIEDKGPRRNTKIALWRKHSVDIPAMIYVTTRIIPLMALDGDY
jgi:very-short-patch-repair endonuclease